MSLLPTASQPATCTLPFLIVLIQYSIVLSVFSVADDMKRQKCYEVEIVFHLVPVAVETSKIIHSAGCSLLIDIDCWVAWATDVLSQLSNVFLQISVAIIQGNVLDMMSSLRRYDRICLMILLCDKYVLP